MDWSRVLELTLEEELKEDDIAFLSGEDENIQRKKRSGTIISCSEYRTDVLLRMEDSEDRTNTNNPVDTSVYLPYKD
eukprot:789039-Pleurochrysis_carterae.AAC.1